uniref:Methyltransferase type 11 domain-containing protein n=1 Tax=Cannabis sativa TaxID=3483 RepID=A0A803P9K3_CANSA
MFRDTSSCNTYNYGDALYWDARYIQEGGSFDWYQRYSALRPFVRNYFPTSSRVLMVGCGNAVMSEDMVKDGYEDIMNIDISSVAIEMMKRKHVNTPQLKYMQMDVRDMSIFPDESFDGVLDKGTLDSLMCGTDAPVSTSQMLGEVSRLLKPGGIYMLITYGDPRVRMPHLNKPVYNWKIMLYIIPRPGFKKRDGDSSSTRPSLEPIPTTENGLLPTDFILEDPDSHFIYICKKLDETELITNVL